MQKDGFDIIHIIALTTILTEYPILVHRLLLINLHLISYSPLS